MTNLDLHQTTVKPGFSMRDLLFGDLPLDNWAAMGTDVAPWNLFLQASVLMAKGDRDEAIKILHEIIGLRNLESRQYLQAYNVLREYNVPLYNDVIIFGIIAEVGMEDGWDQVAIYADHSARYINYSGSMIIWEHPDDSLNKQVDEILEIAKGMLKLMGPWNGRRPEAPGNGYARINFLTSHGLHFGQAATNDLFNDQQAAPMMYKMLEMMKTLINKNNNTVL